MDKINMNSHKSAQNAQNLHVCCVITRTGVYVRKENEFSF